jgi:MFS family permease
VQTTRGNWLAALHYRDFRLLLIGEILSALGTEMFYVALSWQMYLLTHSALALGLLGLAGFIPAMFFSLLGGNFADAHNRKKILYITQPIFMLCSILLALATFAHDITPLIMYIIAGTVSATVAFDHPARSSLIPNLLDRKDFTNTLSVYEMFEQIARITGPLIAGFFMTLKGQVRFQGRTLLIAVALFGLATILFGFSHVYILSVIALALIGGFDSISVIMRETIQQLATPDTMRGRVASIAMIFWMGGPQLGEFEAGLLAALIGVQLSVVAGGVATIVFVGSMALLVPALRKYQATR